jgi:hypothetical protein
MNELMRRWKVHIFQIEVVNMTKEPIDPFLQFIIGGNYYVIEFSLTVANNRLRLKNYQGVTCNTLLLVKEGSFIRLTFLIWLSQTKTIDFS